MEGNIRELQEAREKKQLDDGILRYEKEVSAQGAGDVKAGKALVTVAMEALIPHFTEQVSLLEDGRAHPSQVRLAYHFMCGFEPDAVAYITSRVMVSAANSGGKVTRTAMRIANLNE